MTATLWFVENRNVGVITDIQKASSNVSSEGPSIVRVEFSKFFSDEAFCYIMYIPFTHFEPLPIKRPPRIN